MRERLAELDLADHGTVAVGNDQLIAERHQRYQRASHGKRDVDLLFRRALAGGVDACDETLRGRFLIA